MNKLFNITDLCKILNDNNLKIKKNSCPYNQVLGKKISPNKTKNN